MKVLVVDDDNFIQKVYEAAFVEKGADVKIASNGQEALDILEKEKFDAVLLDMILPIKDGFAFLDEIKNNKKLNKIPIIVFSSLSQQSDIDEALKLGAKKYLPKDEHSPNEIVSEVINLLKK